MNDIEPGRVILPSRVWRHELAAELQALGHDPEQARDHARAVLGRIVNRAGWQPPEVAGGELDEGEVALAPAWRRRRSDLLCSAAEPQLGGGPSVVTRSPP